MGGFEAENGADEKEDGDAHGMWEGGWYTYVKPRRIVGDLLAFKVDSKFDVVPLIENKNVLSVCLSSSLIIHPTAEPPKQTQQPRLQALDYSQL